MTEPRYDVAKADQKLMALGELILRDEAYRRAWQALALVIELDGGASGYGYVYIDDGDWSAATPKNFDVLDAAEALQDAMRVDGVSWKACLIQIKKPDIRMKVDFEYDRADRWKVTPANLEQRVEELRPR